MPRAVVRGSSGNGYEETTLICAAPAGSAATIRRSRIGSPATFNEAVSSSHMIIAGKEISFSGRSTDAGWGRVAVSRTSGWVSSSLSFSPEEHFLQPKVGNGVLHI